MIGLLIILILFIRYKFYIDRLEICDILSLTIICISGELYGNLLYFMIDEFIRNNTWAFLLLVFCTGIYAISK